MNSELTAERLRELFTYDPETGVFSWRARTSNRIKIGDAAGSRDHGCICIVVHGNRYYAHRLAWLYMHGEWPAKQIDHLNGDRCDNRITNLCEASNNESLQNLSAERLRGLLYYNPLTGEFMRIRRRGRTKIGERPGHTDEHGYSQIFVDGFRYKAHRLAWLYVHGVFPVGFIDHINGNKSDNRIANLRDADALINVQNLHGPKGRNASGFLGVSRKRDRWRASIRANGKQLNLGSFDTPELAYESYVRAKRELHQGCTI
jgi:hypothetical protein